MDNEKNAVKKETGLGTIRVADEVVSIIAGLATTEVAGVAGMSGGIAGGIDCDAGRGELYNLPLLRLCGCTCAPGGVRHVGG